MNETPFVFGKLATDVDFTDREEESEFLAMNFQSLVNTIILSPRRWGKTSLVKRVSEELTKNNPKIKICQIDLFNVRTEGDFYLLLASEILKSTSSKWEELAQNAKEFLSKFIPQITFSPDNQNEISFGIGLEELKKSPDEILNLAESIAVSKGYKIVICIDEFQSLSDFEHPLAFQKKLRSHWQLHTHVAYCLYGSKRHMLLDVFSNPSMPFYKFGNLMFLEKIPTQKWAEYIKNRFTETGKTIDNDEAILIADMVENHSYYVQQLAQQTWLRTDKKCSAEIVAAAHNSVVNQLSLLFTNITESLATTHLNFLKAVISGETQLSSKSTLQQYNLGTSANIARIKQALLNREIIDINANQLTIQDPIYKYWLTTEYFKLQLKP